MEQINLKDGEYYGNFNTYFKIEGNKMIVSCHLEFTNQILNFEYQRVNNKFINISKKNDYFDVISKTDKYIIMFDSSGIPIEIKEYTLCHKIMHFFGYVI
jgi:homoserine trans-succinylase